MSGLGAPTNDKYITQVSLVRNAAGPKPTVKGAQRVSPEFVKCIQSGGAWQSTSISVITTDAS
jgi:hypothetical protein